MNVEWVHDIVTEAAPGAVLPAPTMSVVALFHRCVCPPPTVRGAEGAFHETTSVTRSPMTLVTFTDGFAPLDADAEANVPSGVVWWTFLNDRPPPTRPLKLPLASETAILAAPDVGLINRHISIRPLLEGAFAEPTLVRLTPP